MTREEFQQKLQIVAERLKKAHLERTGPGPIVTPVGDIFPRARITASVGVAGLLRSRNQLKSD